MKGRSISQILGDYADSGPARFHMPGHKGRGFFSAFQADIAQWDITELAFSDNLHAPSGVIRTAQHRMAEAYGAERSFFVVTGSTTAVQAMILSLDPSEKLLLSRDAHKAAVHALALSGIETEYLFPSYSSRLGMTKMPSPEQIAEALDQSRATAFFLTSPNYYGFCSDIRRIGEICRERNVLLLVDCAHGAHFPFSESLPAGLSGHADIWTHSQHKTMDALTPGASLHLGKCRIDPERVAGMLGALETSSPSYPIMASLDWSVYMAERRDWTSHVRSMIKLEESLCSYGNGIRNVERAPHDAFYERDRSRLLLDVTGCGLTGYMAGEYLEQNGIYPEMTDERRIVCITSPADDPKWFDRLTCACRNLPEGSQKDFLLDAYPPIPTKAMSVREAFFSLSERKELMDAAGKIAARPIGLYPPGTPILYPGEEISAEIIRFLHQMESRGATLFGLYEGMVSIVK